MNTPDNVASRVLAVAERFPDRPAVVGDLVQLNFAQLRSLSFCIALHLKRNGVGRRSTVALSSDDLIVVLGCLIATALVGARFARATSDLAKSGAPEVSHWMRTPEQADVLDRRAIVIDHTWAHPPEDVPPGFKPQFEGFRSSQATWLLAQTSGTTGRPKFVAISYESMLARALAAKSDYLEGVTRVACLFPFTSFPFVVRAITALVNGCTIVQSSNPGSWARAGVTLVMGSPRQIGRLFSDITLKSKLPALHVGGAATSEASAKSLLQNFDIVIDVYGSTETNQATKTIRSLDESGSLIIRSEAIAGTEIEIVDANDVQVGAGTEGIVRLRSPYMATGYVNAPEAEKIAFRDGWFYPGDLGYFGPFGELVVTGRLGDILNIGGVKLNAQAIDVLLQSVPGVTDAISFSVMRERSEIELVAFLSVDPTLRRDDVVAAARQACLQGGGNAAVPSHFLFADELPRNSAGKPDRLKCEFLASKFRLEHG